MYVYDINTVTDSFETNQGNEICLVLPGHICIIYQWVAFIPETLKSILNTALNIRLVLAPAQVLSLMWGSQVQRLWTKTPTSVCSETGRKAISVTNFKDECER